MSNLLPQIAYHFEDDVFPSVNGAFGLASATSQTIAKEQEGIGIRSVNT